MAFAVRNWQNGEAGGTPLNEEALESLEARLSDYTDSVAGGVELGYASITSNFVQTGVGNSDVTGLSITVTVGARPVLLRAYAGNVASSSGSGLSGLAILESSTILTNSVAGLGGIHPLTCEARVAPSAGSHTYKANLFQVIAGNTTITASTTQPAFIQAIQL